jgi:hypothetical protein
MKDSLMVVALYMACATVLGFIFQIIIWIYERKK